MPIYSYECASCNVRFDELSPSIAECAAAATCEWCGGQADRVMSRFAIGNAVAVGPGRAAYPSTWEDVHGGDPDVLRYWRRRIERETREEEGDPELVKHRAAVAAEAAERAPQSPHGGAHDQCTRNFDWRSVPVVRPRAADGGGGPQ